MLFAFCMFLAILAAMALLVFIMGKSFVNRLGKTGELESAAEEAGKRQGDADIQQIMQEEQEGADIDINNLDSSGMYTVRRPKRMAATVQRNDGGHGKRRAMGFGAFLLIATVCVLAPLTADARIEFGEVHGRFKCEDILRCGGDNTYHELRLRVYPVFEQFSKTEITPWALVPTSAADRISSPLSCDPKRLGQCYLPNDGTAQVNVTAGRAYWRHQVTQYPVLEFPATYKTAVDIYPDANVSDIAREYWDCTTLLNDPDLFADNGPCYKHACQDGPNVRVTEVIGTGGGCGLFSVLNQHARLTSTLRLEIANGGKRGGFVEMPDVYPGAVSRSVDGMIHVHVDSYHVPGGEYWNYPTSMPGKVVVCGDWRKVWNEASRFPVFSRHFTEQNWYYVSPGRLLGQYGTKTCGGHGVSLYLESQSVNGGQCNASLYDSGGCLPEQWPQHVLDSLSIAGNYTPPHWVEDLQNMFLKQYLGKVKTVLWPAKSEHFKFGEIYYDLLVRVASNRINTVATQRTIAVAAVCLEEEALQCVTDPYALVTTVRGRVKNTALNVSAIDASASIQCSYKSKVGPPVPVGSFVSFIGDLNPSQSAPFSWSVKLPDIALEYNNGVLRPRGSAESPQQFECELTVEHSKGNYTIDYKWEGTVTCEQFVNVIGDIPEWKVDCGLHGDDDADLGCYLYYGEVDEQPAVIIYLVIYGTEGVILIGLVIAIYFASKHNKEVAIKHSQDMGRGLDTDSQ